ncbi:alcohol oxidase-like protein, partial [Mycena pura]
MSAPHSIQPEYDLVFAGGGTTACIVASRIATAFPHLSVLVLESGPSTKDMPAYVQPGQFFKHLLPTSIATQFVASYPSPALGGRPLVVPTGHCIGGGSSINFMMYNRPAASDFDDWADFGNAGWGSRDLIPLLQQAETYEIGPDRPTHGAAGPLKVSFGGQSFDLGREFLDLGPRLDPARPFSEEGNGFDAASVNVFYKMPKWISRDGRRSDVAHHYVYNAGLANLAVLDGCLVARILTEDGVATGVEYLFDKRVYPSAPQDRRTVRARKLVLLAAGALNSPLVLERSGIGRADALAHLGVPLVSALPGVGENYQDHAFIPKSYVARPDMQTLDAFLRGDPETWRAAQERWEEDGSGILGANGIDVGIKLRPTPEEAAAMGPDFLKYWTATLADHPDKPVCTMASYPGLLVASDPGALPVPPPKFLTLSGFLAYPASRGRVHAASTDPYDAPAFDSGFLTHPADIAALRWLYKQSREYARRLPSYRGAFRPFHPRFPEGGPAAESIAETAPVALSAPRAVYSAEDDAAIDENVRESVQTTWHSLGTCAMKPRAEGGVVDSSLNVYGVQKLKIIDMSIAPSNVCANTYSVAVAIGEKAACIIAEELRAACA